MKREFVQCLFRELAGVCRGQKWMVDQRGTVTGELFEDGFGVLLEM